MEIHSLQELDQALRNGMVLAIDDGTVTSKVDVTTIEKHAIETYVGSTLAGSAQSVKSALDGLNSDAWMLRGGTRIPVNSDLNTYFTPGNYGVASSADARTMSGLPFETGSGSIYAFNLKVENAALNDSNARRQILQYFNDRQRWIRYGTVNTSTWSAWEREPSRAEVDALNSNTIGSRNAYTATSSSTGQFEALCAIDGTYSIYVTDANGNYCYGQFTIKKDVSNKWETTTNSGITYNTSNSVGTLVFRGGTAPYTAYVVRQTYTPSNATLETLNARVTALENS